jgi:hypothetical protein
VNSGIGANLISTDSPAYEESGAPLLANRPAIFAAAMSIVRHHAPSWCHLVPPHTASRSREMERSAQSWQELSAVDHIA